MTVSSTDRTTAGTTGLHRGRVRIGGDRAHVVVHMRALLVTITVLAATAALAVLGLTLGEFPVSPAEVIGAFTGRVDGLAATVVLEWRLPRVAAAVVFGAALAVAGGVFQTLTRNPLASPDIVGLANGSFTGMILALLLLGGSWPLLMAGSLFGGLAAAVVIALLAARDGLRGFRFIVIGIGVSAMLASLNSWMLLRADLETALFAAAWGAGSLNNVTEETAWPAIGVLAILLALCAFLVRPLKQLSLGDDVATATGIGLVRSRLALIGVAVALVAVVTTVAGPVAFVALAAPQIARRLVAGAGIPLAASAAMGGALLLGADLIAQHAIPLTVPVGVVTVVIGGAYLVVLIARELRTVP
ncbi:FecCD family ABC transporter permease [Salininema proteolyticum]|uniref:FecCD family ABC transporter permease n=1 Tax=Salininema proteolyticum TaxID=1607685 RepID=A0ABV8TU70_9ACTN